MERLKWRDGLTFSSFGVRIGIRTNQPGLVDLLRDALPPGATAIAAGPVRRLYSLVIDDSGAPGERAYLLYEDMEQIGRLKDRAKIIKFLETRVRRSVAEMAPRRVFVHAGVVGYRGRAIVIPGPTMSGKSTLVAELVRRGATYYSDEYAVLDERGLVHPFPKPISLRVADTFEQIDYDIGYFGGSVGSRPLPIGLVVVARYEPAATWRLRPLTHGQGVLAIMSHTIAARRYPARVMATLRQATAEARVLKGARSEASDSASQLLEMIGIIQPVWGLAEQLRSAARKR